MRTARNPERSLLGLLALWSLLPLVIILLDPPAGISVWSGRGSFTGSDGIQIGDHLQYIAWIRDAGEHVLFSNQLDVVDDPHLFLHPMWVVSGAAWQLGASLQLAFLLWNPVGVLILFWGFAAYVRRMLGPSSGARAAGLALALFFFAPVAWVTDWTGIGSPDLRFGSLVIALELFPAGCSGASSRRPSRSARWRCSCSGSSACSSPNAGRRGARPAGTSHGPRWPGRSRRGYTRGRG